MSIETDKIFKLLSEEGFKDPATGRLFFPAYIYTYNPADEYEMRREIQRLNEMLSRPNNNLRSMLINIFDEFLEYLKGQEFDNSNILEEVIRLERDDSIESNKYLTEEARDKFINYMGEKFSNYFVGNMTGKVYLLVHGFGSIYPWLRVSHFLKNTEKYIKNFKIIVFYPGEFSDDTYSLFGILNDDNVYRANHINELIKSTK